MPHPQPLAGETLPAATIRALATRGSYAPALTADTTDPTLGTFGSTAGDWYMSGSLMTVQFEIQFGTGGSAAGSGVYAISLPSGIEIDASWPNGTAIGQARLRDDSTSADRYVAVIVPTNSARDRVRMAIQSNSSGSVISSSNPWTWGANDLIRGTCTFMVAE